MADCASRVSRTPAGQHAAPDYAVIAARAALQREANAVGGSVVESACSLCGAAIHGHVMVDSGEPRTMHAPGIPAHLYVVGFVRNCNCNEPLALIESGLIGAAIIERECAA